VSILEWNVHATLTVPASVSPRKRYLLFSTKNPSTIQRMPWPMDDEVMDSEELLQTSYDTWIVNDEDFAWMVEPDGMSSRPPYFKNLTRIYPVSVVDINYSRAIGSETWITSDGRVYLVQLHEESPKAGRSDHDGERAPDFSSPERPEQVGWNGTCIHNFDTPKWVQKQRYRDPNVGPQDPNQRVWEEPRRAVTVAVNSRFSLFAIGTASGQIELTPFPSQGNVIPKSHKIPIPNAYNRPSGEVRSLDWSSDGYVLAVAWTTGWGVFSVGGRCLASSFNMEYNFDREKYVSFTHHGKL
jgi:RAB6A-GEF complex partner protein 1